ncbi:murein tripeptide amidase A [Vibrio chagasii]|nr:murein tripeptide amidase A [Vibrio chagasii]CAH7002589.1 murein tripeptide amidase A [Vibrio chagasii]CAH7027493.1 murein tripeptide amidase A [Vibrio chagasii]CAH7335516.1 murein tripeptide amidase A [Vibrio chagasii]CAH7338337.1 murein tripeptide amidase A [Vibrio chagasii]
MSLIPRTERAAFSIEPLPYGNSVLGAPLLYFPAQVESESRGLIIAGTHGDETASIAGLSCALRSLPVANLRHDVILSMNPDGNQLGTRANANQVDLNRAFPTQNWTEDGTVYRWSSHTPVRDVKVKTGQAEQLEPEVQSLISLIEQRKPKFVISFHEPLAMVDDPTQSELASWLGKQFNLPLVEDVDYETPGSFGTWCQERSLSCITVELPPVSADLTIEQYLDAFMAVLGCDGVG